MSGAWAREADATPIVAFHTNEERAGAILSRLGDAMRFQDGENRKFVVASASAHIRAWRRSLPEGVDTGRRDIRPAHSRFHLREAIRAVLIADEEVASARWQANSLRLAEAHLREWWRQEVNGK